MERWRIVDCSTMEGSVIPQRGAVEIRKEGCSPALLPVADIAVVLLGLKVHFSTGLIHRLLSNDIAVVFCDWKGVPEGAAYGWSVHGRVGARHSAQAALSEPRRKNAWGRIVTAKVKGQANVLSALGRSGAREVASLSREVRSGDPRNVEARAARVYWQNLWDRPGFSRNPGADVLGGDQRNAMLDYAYTVLRGFGIRAVIGAGLSPALGVFHRARGNNFALVDDLIEPFRPAVDSAVLCLPADSQIDDPLIRKRLVEAASRKFSDDGSSIPSVFSEFARQFGMYVEGDVQKLLVPTWCEG